ncbi:MAG TPA: PilX N-terminal domain-containing pilus assembly protein [Candidatus Eisenbacteria bacterium]|jgi:Tfp pilus assembly protein PilX|nr:PilX N-terminal domain-containing pilus assembly protein [Candidatus Eisenbacteria bacterium]
MRNHIPSRRRVRGQHGIALITTMLLLLLLTAMSLTMVLSVSSDMLLTGYYGNYRGSFYAADSGINIARQQVVDSLNKSIPVPFDPATGPAIGTTTAMSQGKNGYATFAPINSAYSWPEKVKITDIQIPPAGSVVGCTPTGGTTGNCAAPYAKASDALSSPVLKYVYTVPYQITAVGQSQGTETATIVERGAAVVTAKTGLGTQTTSFAGFGMFIDQYALCGGGDLVPGTITGPVWTNGSWNFSNSGSYTFTDDVTQVGSKAGFDKSGICSGSTTVPSGFSVAFQNSLKNMTFGAAPAALPANSFNQQQAVLDGIGNSSTAPTALAMNGVLKDATGNAYPKTGASSGVYLPYTVDSTGKIKTFTGGGILVEGSATVVVQPGSNGTAQVYKITQGGVTTTVTTDPAAGSAGTTTIQVGSTGPVTSINGVPQQFSSSGVPMGTATMLYVDGDITSLSGPGAGKAGINDGVAVTICATNDVTVTGDVLYKTDPVYMSGTQMDQLIPGGDTGQVLGIFTAKGNVNLNNKQSNPNNLEIDASIATISQGGSGGIVNTGSAINTLTIVGGRIQNTIQNINSTTRNVLFDRRFGKNGFAPPWFPSTTITPTAGTGQSVATTVQRYTWLNQTMTQ